MTPRPTVRVSPTPRLKGVLRRGNSGDQVTLLQQRLRELGYLTQTADGIFGSATEKALIAFQNINGLSPDGIAGEQTLVKLYGSAALSYRTATSAPTATPAPVTLMPTVQVTVPVVTLSPTGQTVPVTSPQPSQVDFTPTADQVINANWYTAIRGKAKLMPDVRIFDPVTGISYRLHLFSFGKHADGETPSAVDTALMYQVCGTNSWTPHAVWVVFDDGSVYLASTHSHGHEVDHTPGNNLDGHVCLHFPRLMYEAEATGPYAVSHQKAILAEWERIQSLVKTQTAQ